MIVQNPSVIVRPPLLSGIRPGASAVRVTTAISSVVAPRDAVRSVFSAGLQGPRGAQGEQGKIGRPGPAGPQGAQGIQGPIGLPGSAASDVVAFTMSCDPLALAVGDVVRLDPAANNSVVKCVDNTAAGYAIGVVLTVDGLANVCGIQAFGMLSFSYPGISRGDRIFLGIDGKPTGSVPSTGYIQEFGFSPETRKIFVNFGFERTKRA